MMIKGNKLRQPLISRLHTKYFLSYIAIILVVSAVFMPVYRSAALSIKRTVEENNQAILDAKMQLLDEQLLYLQSIADILRNSPDVSVLAQHNGSRLPNATYYNIRQASSYIGNVLIESTIIERAFLVFKNNPIFISKNFVADDIAKAYGSYIKYEDMTLSQFKTSIQYDETPVFLPPQKMIGDPSYSRYVGSEQVISYIIPTKSRWQNGACDSALICLISVDRLEKLLVDKNDNYLQLVINDENGNILFHYNSSVEEQLHDEDILVLHSELPAFSLCFSASIGRFQFLKQVQRATQMINLVFAMSILFGLIISVLLSYRNSRPLVKLQKDLRTALSTNGTSFSQETSHELSDFSSIEKIYNHKLKQMNLITVYNIFDRLLRQQTCSDDDKVRIHNLLPALEGKYMVAVFHLGENVVAHSGDKRHFYLAALSLELQDAFEEKVNCLCHLHIIDHVKFVLLLSVPSGSRGQNILKVELKSVCTAVREKYNLRLLLCISHCVEGCEKLNQAYDEAWCLLRQKEGNYQDELCFVPEITESDMKSDDDSFQNISELNFLLLSGDTAGAVNIIESIYKKITEMQIINGQQIMQIFFSIYNILFIAASKIDANFTFSDLQYSENLTVSELFNSLQFNAVRLCENVSKKRNKCGFINEFEQYIKNNYSNCNLCARIIAENFNLSEKYLFALIKESTGRCVGDYIEQVRIEESKNLLQNSHMKIAGIALCCGYYSPNSFYKAFRRCTGISPSVYRDLKVNRNE